ncbi:MAG: AI-2E family transporter [Delftia acidovorans]|jgi:predicted PurR-regulated permease PerM|uniref:AI-2E family transporter n=1 Tax=Delftia acidovorans TaxID=80866 RepID=UPI00281FA000|nr:AI-2E family transporter [Delftia acidovorans]MDR3016565.1 AI-2E family transporter [Delftia acidovorans]
MTQHLPSPIISPQPAPTRGVTLSSYVLMAGALLLIMWQGLLPGMLCVCVGFLVTRALAGLLARAHPKARRGSLPRWTQLVAATIVILAPLALLSGALSHTRTYITDAPQQYRELLDYLAHTVLELRDKLPADMADQLPDGAQEIQHLLASYLAAKAGALAHAGRAWLTGLLYAYVGLIIGALAAVRPITTRRPPLVAALRERIRLMGLAFRQIVAAQFWIAAFNTFLTAIFLLGVLPHWNLTLPYTPALITLTFIAGLVPIVGNLLCNAVITIVGLSVSPVAAAACLGFLILIHKAEYVINAKVVGQRTHMGVWELLAVMFVAESVFGPAGLVAAPLFYAYLKKELEAVRLV